MTIPRFLHVCGGDPTLLNLTSWWESVFSTYVEVILRIWLKRLTSVSFLHVCGGDPMLNTESMTKLEFSPRMWRWSQRVDACHRRWYVFSTYVEVILKESITMDQKFCFLHVCGGDPIIRLIILLFIAFSPRMWRWSSQVLTTRSVTEVFSTYVEVILGS